MRDDLVSIVMPVYNGEDFIEDAVRSVQNQTVSNWELLISDDCSSDDSLEIATAFERTDPRIRVIKTGSRSGPAAARNRAIRLSAGRWIAFLDCDDAWHPEKLASTLRFMARKNLALAFTAYNRKSSSGVEPIFVPRSVTLSALLKTNFIATSTVILDRRHVPKFAMNESVGYDDYFAWLEIFRRGLPAAGLNRELTTYRKSQASVSSDKLRSARAVLRMMWRDLQLSPPEVIWYFLNYSLRGAIKHLKVFRWVRYLLAIPARKARKSSE